LRWKYAGGKVMRGLEVRREAEAGLYAWDAPYYSPRQQRIE
jgi:GH24 family phage-related lysozyme (muramidase)